MDHRKLLDRQAIEWSIALVARGRSLGIAVIQYSRLIAELIQGIGLQIPYSFFIPLEHGIGFHTVEEHFVCAKEYIRHS